MFLNELSRICQQHSKTEPLDQLKDELTKRVK